MNAIAGIHLNRILRELAVPEAYNHPVENLRVIQTHASAVFLTGKYAYKVKKPVNFEFLDYSQLELRHKFCLKELQLNRRLSDEIYLDVVPITDYSGQLRMRGPGKAVEWAVRMHQLPEKDMLPTRLCHDSVSVAEMERLADALATFHQTAVSGPEIAAFGDPQKIRINLQENFTQTEQFINDELTAQQLIDIKHYSEGFLGENESLFRNRKIRGFIRDGHGDLRIQNICLYPHMQEGIQILDCIEFNDRFRFEDVAADLAYLLMDLDLSARSDLRRAFLDAYIRYSEDQELLSILSFYMCYRAFVRGKIALLTLAQPETPLEQRSEQKELAAAAFDLAHSYALHRSPPMLIITTGVSGSGKSVLSHELARRLPAVLLSSDKIRRELAAGAAQLPVEMGWYRPDRIALVYEELRKRAGLFLRGGEHVILDATFLSTRERERVAAVATSYGVAFRILDCRCPEDVARKRIAFRQHLTGHASDATAAVLEMQLKNREPIQENAIHLDMELPPRILARQVLAVL